MHAATCPPAGATKPNPTEPAARDLPEPREAEVRGAPVQQSPPEHVRRQAACQQRGLRAMGHQGQRHHRTCDSIILQEREGPPLRILQIIVCASTRRARRPMRRHFCGAGAAGPLGVESGRKLRGRHPERSRPAPPLRRFGAPRPGAPVQWPGLGARRLARLAGRGAAARGLARGGRARPWRRYRREAAQRENRTPRATLLTRGAPDRRAGEGRRRGDERLRVWGCAAGA